MKTQQEGEAHIIDATLDHQEHPTQSLVVPFEKILEYVPELMRISQATNTPNEEITNYLLQISRHLNQSLVFLGGLIIEGAKVGYHRLHGVDYDSMEKWVHEHFDIAYELIGFAVKRYKAWCFARYYRDDDLQEIISLIDRAGEKSLKVLDAFRKGIEAQSRDIHTRIPTSDEFDDEESEQWRQETAGLSNIEIAGEIEQILTMPEEDLQHYYGSNKAIIKQEPPTLSIKHASYDPLTHHFRGTISATFSPLDLAAMLNSNAAVIHTHLDNEWYNSLRELAHKLYPLVEPLEQEGEEED